MNESNCPSSQHANSIWILCDVYRRHSLGDFWLVFQKSSKLLRRIIPNVQHKTAYYFHSWHVSKLNWQIMCWSYVKGVTVHNTNSFSGKHTEIKKLLLRTCFRRWIKLYSSNNLTYVYITILDKHEWSVLFSLSVLINFLWRLVRRNTYRMFFAVFISNTVRVTSKLLSSIAEVITVI